MRDTTTITAVMMTIIARVAAARLAQVVVGFLHAHTDAAAGHQHQHTHHAGFNTHTHTRVLHLWLLLA